MLLAALGLWLVLAILIWRLRNLHVYWRLRGDGAPPPPATP
ncbi:MAG TPA: hypothetical protein VK696_02840 [Steroidobacteraceae bacterium]|jgi:hypothetical protein|nr:hypothetical protein [Steroidobacteraceae bacterium]